MSEQALTLMIVPYLRPHEAQPRLVCSPQGQALARGFRVPAFRKGSSKTLEVSHRSDTRNYL
jgi:hypothetical protein